MKRDAEEYPALPSGKAMSPFAKGLISTTMAVMQQTAGMIGHAADSGAMAEEEAIAILTLMAEFSMSCCANGLLGRPAQGDVPLPTAETAKAVFRLHFSDVIEDAATEGLAAIEHHIERLAAEGADQSKH